MLNLGLRVGIRPRKLITTTPRPSQMLQAIIAGSDHGDHAGQDGPTTPKIWRRRFIAGITDDHAPGTRLGRQEIPTSRAVDGRARRALWTRDMLDGANGADCRI